MEKEEKQAYSARVVQANRTELLVIVYEILEGELRQAFTAFEKEDFSGFDIALQNAQKFLNELMGTLNYQFRVSYQLLSIYRFINRTLIECRLKKQRGDLQVCIDMVDKLRSAYAKIAEQDNSAPLMENVQKLYTGLTYGRQTLSEVSVDAGTGRRGFYA